METCSMSTGILATYGPVKILTSVCKQNCDLATYGPGKILCFVKLNPNWVCNIATYGPLKYLYYFCIR